MTRYEYLIIGGGIAGVTAAETIHEEHPSATIGVIAAEPHILYSRVLLPHYLKKKIQREQLFLRRAEDFTKKNIDLRLAEAASFVDIRKKEVGLTNRMALGYEKLLIASGGRVRPWDQDINSQFLFRLQTMDDADRLMQKLPSIRNPVVIGSSFIGLEFLEIFSLNGYSPQALIEGPHFFSRIFDPDGGKLMQENFERNGIRIRTGDSIGSGVSRGATLRLTTKGGDALECDAVALGIGIDRAIDFLRGSGIALGTRGIKTNEYLETDAPDVFAAGDIAEFVDVTLEKTHVVGNWTNAFLQGKRAGLNMAGKREPFRAVPAYSITNLGLQITALGDTDAALETISRTYPPRAEYERFFMREGVLVGASLINRFQDKTHLTKLIESKTRIGAHKEKLSDFAFDIHTIPVVD